MTTSRNMFLKKGVLWGLLGLGFSLSQVPARADFHHAQLICQRHYDGTFTSTYPLYADTVNYPITIISNQYTPAGSHSIIVYNTNNPSSPTAVAVIYFNILNNGMVQAPGQPVGTGSYNQVVGSWSFSGDNGPYTAADVNTQFPPTYDNYEMVVDGTLPVANGGTIRPDRQATFGFESDFIYQNWLLTHSGIFSFLGQTGPYEYGNDDGVTYTQPIKFCFLVQPPGQPFACPGGCACLGAEGHPGMPVASLDRFQAGVAISDTPAGYTPPLGRDMHFSINYHQRLTGQPTTFNYSNLGQQWLFGWMSYIGGGPTNGQTDATHYAPDGSQDVYGGYQNYVNQGLGSTPQNIGDFVDNQAWTLATLHYRQGPQRYERWLPDGTIEVYAQAVGTSPNQLFFLTSITDPQGNVTTLAYDQTQAALGNARLVSITDPNGGQLLFSYGLVNFPLQITQVTRSYDGKSAKLGYTNGQLTSITDMQGITSSFQYASGTNFINQMNTPYGTTRFHSQDGSGFLEADMTNPLGQTERIEYQQSLDPSVFPASEAQTPSVTGMLVDNINLNNNNSFYWDRRAMARGAQQGDRD